MHLTARLRGTKSAGIRASLGRLHTSSALTFIALILLSSIQSYAQTTGAAFNLPACAGISTVDDTPILWNAMSLASSNVFFLSPAKICHVNFVGGFSLPAGTRLVGTPGRSVLRPFTNSQSLAVINHSDITLEGITFDAFSSALGGNQSTLLFVAKASRVALINDCFLSSVPGGAATGNAVWYWNSSGRIQGNDFTSFQNQIIVKTDPGVNPVVSITGNRLHDNSALGGNAIEITNDGGSTKVDAVVTIDGNSIQNIYASSNSSGQDGNAIDLYLVNHARVSNNQVNKVGFSCFRSASSDDSVFTSNSCLNAGESAAYSEFTSQHNQWIGNYFESPHGSCLNLTNIDVGGQLHSAVGNHMVKCGTNGIAAEGNAVVAGNVIDQAQNGILIGYGAFGINVLVKDNLITDTSGANVTRFGIGVEEGSTSGIEIEGNKISINERAITGTSYGSPSTAGTMPASLTIRNQSLSYSLLGSAANGSSIYCSDCVSGPSPAVCKPAGHGAFATRTNGTWSCR